MIGMFPLICHSFIHFNLLTIGYKNAAIPLPGRKLANNCVKSSITQLSITRLC